jgi:DNA-binding transcriptional ArsR family regulator
MDLDAALLSRFSANAEQAVALLKAAANDSRLLVLCHLAVEGELSVSQLQERVRLGQSALSQHLAKLRDENIVATRKEAQTVFYRVCDPKAARLLNVLHELFCPELGQGD